MKIKVSNLKLKPKLILSDINHKYLGYKNLENEENEIDLDLNKVKYINIKYGKKKTENLILSDNLKIIDFSYNKKRKLYDVSIETEKPYGKVVNEINKSEYFKYRKSKKITYYYSNDFKNKDVHLLVFFDSQNIFNLKNVGAYTTKNDPYKGWQIEVPIEESGKNFLVLSIENADKYRSFELTPRIDKKDLKYPDDFPERYYLPGNLDILGSYLDEKIKELKEEYDIIDIGIAGASMGGLASFYLGLKDNYDYIFSFSPAYGFIKDSWWKEFYKKCNLKNKKLISYIGGNDWLERHLDEEGKNILELLLKAGFDKNNLYTLKDKGLKHNEIAWRYVFNYYFNEFYNK